MYFFDGIYHGCMSLRLCSSASLPTVADIDGGTLLGGPLCRMSRAVVLLSWESMVSAAARLPGWGGDWKPRAQAAFVDERSLRDQPRSRCWIPECQRRRGQPVHQSACWRAASGGVRRVVMAESERWAGASWRGWAATARAQIILSVGRVVDVPVQRGAGWPRVWRCSIR